MRQNPDGEDTPRQDPYNSDSREEEPLTGRPHMPEDDPYLTGQRTPEEEYQGGQRALRRDPALDLDRDTGPDLAPDQVIDPEREMDPDRDWHAGVGPMKQARDVAPGQSSDDPYLDGNPGPNGDAMYGDGNSGQTADQ